MKGSGQVNKDKTIEEIISTDNSGKQLPADELSILQIYDLFCCDYKSKEIVCTAEDTSLDRKNFLMKVNLR